MTMMMMKKMTTDSSDELASILSFKQRQFRFTFILVMMPEI